MVDAGNLATYAFLLIGIIFLIQGLSSVYLLIKLKGFFDNLITTMNSLNTLSESMPGAQTSQSTIMPSFTNYFILGWIFTAFEVLTGVLTIIASLLGIVQSKKQ